MSAPARLAGHSAGDRAPGRAFHAARQPGKRVRFLRQVQHELGLNNIEPVQSRVEEFPAEPPFDGVISRAFASLQDMLSGAITCRRKGRGVLRVERRTPG